MFSETKWTFSMHLEKPFSPLAAPQSWAGGWHMGYPTQGERWGFGSKENLGSGIMVTVSRQAVTVCGISWG